MLKKQNSLSSLTNEIKKWIKKSKVTDVVLFGSSVRGKHVPNDLDLCIIISDVQEKESLDLIDSLSRHINSSLKKANIRAQINILTESSFFRRNSLAKTLLVEGFSIKHSSSLAQNIGFEPKAMFFYELEHFKPSERVRFHYLLRGRYGQPGLLKENNAELLKDGLIEVPLSNEDLFEEVLSRWNVKFKVKHILIYS